VGHQEHNLLLAISHDGADVEGCQEYMGDATSRVFSLVSLFYNSVEMGESCKGEAESVCFAYTAPVDISFEY